MTEAPSTYLLLCLSALAAGAVNSLAGGGTLLTFPALTSVVDAQIANATSTVALVPGSIAGAWGYRAEMAGVGRWALVLIWPSLVGGLVGSLLVAWLPPAVFKVAVPWLILLAATTLLLQPLISRWVGQSAEPAAAPTGPALAAIIVIQFLVSVYGGYFGAGIGIMMLSALALIGMGDIHRMNALKTFLASVINGISVAVFAGTGLVRWDLALSMALTAVAGGYLGARLGRSLNKNVVRWIVVTIGFGLAGYYFHQQLNAAPVSTPATP